jgi:hypothetical protein
MDEQRHGTGTGLGIADAPRGGVDAAFGEYGLLVAHDLLLRNRRVTLCAEKTGRRSPALPQSLAILRATDFEELTRSVETPRE